MTDPAQSVLQLIAVAINMFLPRLLPMINSAALIWSLAGAFTIFIVTLATAAPNYQRGAFVFGGWQNETGWPSASGTCFLFSAHSLSSRLIPGLPTFNTLLT